MLVALDIRTEQVDTVNEVLPGIALPGRDQLPKRVQKVYDCDIVLSQGAGTFVPEEGMSWTVRDFLSCLKPALTEREADVLVFSRTLLNLVNMGSFPYRLADSKLRFYWRIESTTTLGAEKSSKHSVLAMKYGVTTNSTKGWKLSVPGQAQ
eukprot:TRINITY_DN870_c0_g1_i13.p1 TRINITY_DN870_c0_g1~~TRINITY_DN870_c0_g1_i13.p1  ORF type:complete len:151 (-),score=9.42 TRINITY_DN870_c0_g1_i13:22-474(-)